MKQAQTKNTMPASTNMAPALVETYSRLLVYTEIESLGIKGFLGTNLLQSTYSNNLQIPLLFRPTIADGFQIAILEYFAHSAGNAFISNASYSAVVSRPIAVAFAFAGICAAHKSNAIAFMCRNDCAAFDIGTWVGWSATTALAIFRWSQTVGFNYFGWKRRTQSRTDFDHCTINAYHRIG